jgi:hypothetical protein
MEENEGKENSILGTADCYIYRVQRGLRAEIARSFLIANQAKFPSVVAPRFFTAMMWSGSCGKNASSS